jgi:hypothetical protein
MEFRRSTSWLDELGLVDPAQSSLLIEQPRVSHSNPGGLLMDAGVHAHPLTDREPVAVDGDIGVDIRPLAGVESRGVAVGQIGQSRQPSERSQLLTSHQWVEEPEPRQAWSCGGEAVVDTSDLDRVVVETALMSITVRFPLQHLNVLRVPWIDPSLLRACGQFDRGNPDLQRRSSTQFDITVVKEGVNHLNPPAVSADMCAHAERAEWHRTKEVDGEPDHPHGGSGGN